MSSVSVWLSPHFRASRTQRSPAVPVGIEQSESVATLLKALSDPVRLRLMSLIAAASEACVCDLTTTFTVSQPTISHHLRVLREAGLVDADRRGTWVYYRARRDALDALGGLFTGSLARQ
jgi:ArsR family transcriptional regulator, arsenate/arsenite/antimonite-responsive transcriptional repressor